MKRPAGIAILALSFVAVAVFLVGWIHWYWVAVPGQSFWSPLAIGFELMFIVGVGAVGVGLLELNDHARWTAFLCLAALFALGLPATLFDLFAHQGVWLAADLGALVLLAMPAGYLLSPRVNQAFAAHPRAR